MDLISIEMPLNDFFTALLGKQRQSGILISLNKIKKNWSPSYMQEKDLKK